MDEDEKKYFEISFSLLFTIMTDIMKKAVAFNLSDEYLSKCVVRIPKDSDKNDFFYDLGLPGV